MEASKEFERERAREGERAAFNKTTFAMCGETGSIGEKRGIVCFKLSLKFHFYLFKLHFI